jgi:hypothetical protein
MTAPAIGARTTATVSTAREPAPVRRAPFG